MPATKRVVAVDIETFYNDEYSLTGQKGLTMEHYIRNPEFEMQLVCCTDVATGEQFHWDPEESGEEALREMLDPENTIAVMHNFFFDGLALAYHYDIFFAEYVDTAALARWGIGDMKNGKAYWSLKAVSEYFGLKEKDRSALEAVKGKHREEIQGEQWDHFLAYCYDDSLITAQAFTKFMEGPCKRMRPEAMKIMSWTCHNWCNPRLNLDKKVLADYAESVKDGRKQITKMLGTTAKVLRSAPKFKELLETYGVEVGMKTSPTTNKEIPAFAKDDGWMKSAIHEPGMQGLLCRARLAMASNIGVTRADRLVGMANRGHATVALQFCGATNTARFSGTDKINWQNPPKELKKDEPHPIRRSIVAPPGMVLVSCDLSQIEARINAALAGQDDLLDVFRAGGDPYCFFGTDLFGRTITKEDGPERFFSKMCILGLGYRMGWKRFFNECLHKYGMKDMTELRAKETVNFYRRRYSAISGNWDAFDQIPVMMSRKQAFELGRGVQVSYDGGSSNELLTPTGFAMKYPNIRQVVNEETGYKDWVYGAGKGYKMHGGITVENSCQCISGQVMEGQMATVIEQGVDIAMQVHDEIVVICEESIAHDMGKWLVNVMSQSPAWWPELPLAAEYAVGKTFAEAK